MSRAPLRANNFTLVAGSGHLQDKGANPEGTDGRPPLQPDQDLGEHHHACHLHARHICHVIYLGGHPQSCLVVINLINCPPVSPGEDIIPCLEERNLCQLTRIQGAKPHLSLEVIILTKSCWVEAGGWTISGCDVDEEADGGAVEDGDADVNIHGDSDDDQMPWVVF